MAVPFSNTKLRVPKGFQNILEGLAREVLRSQPENIFEFGAKYMEQLMTVRAETGHDPAVHGARLEDRFYNNDSFKSPSIDAGSREQQDAAVKIQSNYRKHVAEVEVETMREEDAAEKIQAGFRGYQDRQKFSDMKSPEKAQDEEEEVDIDLDDPEVEKAAMKIQAGFKGFKARQEVKELKEQRAACESPEVADNQEEEVDIDLNDPEVNEAALKIQAGFRGHQTRKQMKDKKDEQEKHPDIDLNDPEMADAALKIQTGFRGHMARKEIQTMKEEKNKKATPSGADLGIDINDTELDQAAQKIQAGFRGHKARKDVQALKESRQLEEEPQEPQEQEPQEPQEPQEEGKQDTEVDIDLTDPEVENAALKIQAGFKGMKARQEVKSLKESKETEKTDDSKQEVIDIDLDDPETEAAALKIQAGFKGYKTRKEIKDKISQQSEETSKDDDKKDDNVDIDLNDPEVEKAATKIQAGYKGFKTRKDLKESKAGPEPDAAGKTDESAKDDDEVKQEGARIEVSPEKAQQLVNVLSAFSTYKKPDTLPDHLRLTQGHIESVQKWRKMAKRKLKKRTFSSMTQLMGYLPFNSDDLSDLEDDNEEVKDEDQNTKPIVTSQNPDPQKFDLDFDFFGEMKNDSDSDWNEDSDSSSFDDEEFGKRFEQGKQQFNFQDEAQPFMKHVADDMGDVMGNMVSTMMPLQEKVMNKNMLYKPFKAGLEAFEVWITVNRPDLNSRDLVKRQQQLELYQNIVAHMEQMVDSDPEDKIKKDRTMLQMFQTRLTKLGDVPVEVQAKQDEASSTMLTEQPEVMGDIMTQMVSGMEQAMTGLMSGFGGMMGEKTGGDSDDEEQGGQGAACTIL